MDDRKMKESPLLQYPAIAGDPDCETMQLIVYTHMSTKDGIMPDKDHKDEHLKRVEGRLLWKGEQLYHTPRSILVLEGTEKRSVNPNFWVDVLETMEHNDRVAVADWRYVNEILRSVELLEKDFDVYAIRVDVEEKSKSSDASERSLDNYEHFHARIFNKKIGLDIYHQDIEAIVCPLFR